LYSVLRIFLRTKGWNAGFSTRRIGSIFPEQLALLLGRQRQKILCPNKKDLWGSAAENNQNEKDKIV